MNGYERITTLLRGGTPDVLPAMPITMMLAADVAGVPYRSYASDHRVLVEGQLRVAERFDFDHVSVISDPAREASDLGASVRWFDDQPPAIDEDHALLAEPAALARLRLPDPATGPRMSDRLAAVSLLRQRVGGQKLIEGWIEGPVAEAADLRGLNRLMLDFFDEPAFVQDLLEFTLELGVRFAKAQVDAGADLIGVGDAAASLIGPGIYESFVWPCEKRLVDAIYAMGVPVRLHICGDTRPLLGRIGELGCAIVDLDSLTSIAAARAAMPASQVLLGYLDPVRTIRGGEPSSIAAAVAACHGEAGGRFIVGAGCEIPRGTPDANLHALVRYARSTSGSRRQEPPAEHTLGAPR